MSLFIIKKYSPVHYICAAKVDKISFGFVDGDGNEGAPMCSHSAPSTIMRLHSAVSWPKSEARTEGEMIARGIEVNRLWYRESQDRSR
jgi:hypothetical protein